jgi:hypothetical protein
MRTVGRQTPGEGGGAPGAQAGSASLGRQAVGGTWCSAARCCAQACRRRAPPLVPCPYVMMNPLAHSRGNHRPTAAMPCLKHLVCATPSPPQPTALAPAAGDLRFGLSQAHALVLITCPQCLPAHWHTWESLQCSSTLTCTPHPPPALPPTHLRAHAPHPAGAPRCARMRGAHALVLITCPQCLPAHWHTWGSLQCSSTLTCTPHPPPALPPTHTRAAPRRSSALRADEGGSCPSVDYIPTVLASPLAHMGELAVLIHTHLHTPLPRPSMQVCAPQPAESHAPTSQRSHSAGGWLNMVARICHVLHAHPQGMGSRPYGVSSWGALH